MAPTRPPPAKATTIIAWRKTRIHATTHKPMTQQQAADYLGIGLRTYQTYEADGGPAWLGRLIRADFIPPGYHRKGGAK